MKINDTVAKILLLLSFMALGWGLTFSWTLLVVTAIVGWFIVKDQANIFEDLRKGFKPNTGCLSLIFLGLVAFRMRVNGIDLYNHIEGTDLVKFPYTFSGTSFPFLLFDMLISLFTLPGILWIFENIYSHTILSQELINRGGGTLTSLPQETSLSKKDSFLLLLASLVPLAICSQCSPLYPLNYCNDNHIFFLLGDGVLHGKVPYQDLIDHKGPFFLLMHAFDSMIAYPSMIGAWYVEILGGFIFLYFGFKTVRLFFPYANIWLFLPFAFITLSTPIFSAGDSAEEMCLPIYSYVLYNGLKSIVFRKLPDFKSCLLIGICAGIVFWIKFTICGIFVGWFLSICLLAYQQKNLKRLFQISLTIALGLIITTTPIFCYFSHHSALNKLFEVYFGCNSSTYLNSRVLNSTAQSLITFIQYQLPAVFSTPFLVLILSFSFFSVLKIRDKFTIIAFFLIFSFPFVIFFFISSGFPHYYYPLVVFLSLGSYFAIKFAYEHLPKVKKPFLYFVFFVLGSLFSYEISPNTQHISLIKQELPQQRFAKIINEKKNATLLEYYHDGDIPTFFYTQAHVVPNFPFFGLTGAYPKDFQFAYQDSMVNAGSFDFLVTYSNNLDLEFYFPIDSIDGYYLYKHK